jgi:hypothetical protein
VSAEIGWRPVAGEFTLLVVDVEDVTYIVYDADTGGQHVVRWPAGWEYVRPSLTPTSLARRGRSGACSADTSTRRRPSRGAASAGPTGRHARPHSGMRAHGGEPARAANRELQAA